MSQLTMIHRVVARASSSCGCRHYSSSVYQEMLNVLVSKEQLPKGGVSSWNDGQEIEKLLSRIEPSDKKVENKKNKEHVRGRWIPIDSRIQAYSSEGINNTKRGFYQIESSLLPIPTRMDPKQRPISTLRGIIREFVGVGLYDEEFMKRVIKWASTHKTSVPPWDSFYVLVVGSLLSLGKVDFALECHSLIYPNRHLRPTRWWLVIQAAMSHKDGLGGFKRIVGTLPADSTLYGQIIPALTMENRWTEAVEVHWFLTKIHRRFFPRQSRQLDIVLKAISQDYPSPILMRDVSRIRARYLSGQLELDESTVEIILVHMLRKFRHDDDLLERIGQLCKWGGKAVGRSEKFWTMVLKQNQLELREIHKLMDLWWVKKRGGYKGENWYLEALIFRTSVKASRSSIMGILDRIKGQHVLSIEACAHIGKICAFGIDGEFALNLYDVVRERDKEGKVARGIMVGFAMGKHYNEGARFHSQVLSGMSRATKETWNILFRMEIESGQFTRAITTLEEMIVMKIPLESLSAIKLVEYILRPRRKFRGAMQSKSAIGQVDGDLQLSIRVLINCLNSGCGSNIQVEAWREILIRVLQSCGFNAISTLSMYLARVYSTTLSTNDTTVVEQRHRHKGISTKSHSHPLRRLFNSGFVKHIIKQGFDRVPRQPWIGLILLLKLRQACGVYISDEIVKVEVARRLNVLFHPKYTHLTPRHSMLRLRNTYSFNQLNLIFHYIWTRASRVEIMSSKTSFHYDNQSNTIYISPTLAPQYQFKSRKSLLLRKRRKHHTRN